MGFAIATFAGGATTAGMYVSTDFRATGAAPTWERKVGGLPTLGGSVQPQVMAVDPGVPLVRQFLFISGSGGSIYGRNTGVDDDFHLVLDRATAFPIAELDTTEESCNLKWITCDPVVAGRLYTAVDFLNATPSAKSGGALLASDDYGANWYKLSDMTLALGPESWVPLARGVGEVRGRDSDVWAGLNYPLLIGAGAVGFPHAKEPYFVDEGEGYYTTSLGAGWTPYVLPDPISADNDRFCYGATANIVSGQGELIRVSGIAVEGNLTYSILQEGLFLGGTRGYLGSSDRHWIDPDDRDHQRIIHTQGRLFVTNDAWTTVENETPPELSTTNTIGNLVASPNRGREAVFFTTPGKVWAMENEESFVLIDREGDLGLSSVSNNPAHHGLYVDEEITSGIFVQGVELGETGTDEAASAGIPLWGDRGAFNTLEYPQRHARDIKAAQYWHHVPKGNAVGDTLYWDGDKWIVQAASSTPTIVADLVATSIAGGTQQYVYADTSNPIVVSI